MKTRITIFQSVLLLLALSSATATAALPPRETLEHALFGTLVLQRPATTPKGVLLFFSSSAGWNAELDSAARTIAELDYSVVGINLAAYLARLPDMPCVDVAAALSQLPRLIQQRQAISPQLAPLLLGYGDGAAFSYAAMVQAPAASFHAGIGVNFCPELTLTKPLCPGSGRLEATPVPAGQKLRLQPATRLPTTWFVFADPANCPSAAAFAQAIPLARWSAMPGAAASSVWLPPVSALLQWLDPSIPHQAQPNPSIRNVPLIEVPSSGGAQRPQLALLISGDGGWAKLDRTLSAELAQNGLPTVGWDALSYFWKARQPDAVAADLEQVLRHYLQAWGKERLLLIGYSFGADVLPALIHRLPPDLRQRIDLAAFLGLSEQASFEFHLSDWISDAPSAGDVPVRPELEKIKGIKMICVYGTDEEQSACPMAATLGVTAIPMSGDHHFDEDYAGIAKRILEQLPKATESTTPP